jgi:hypothetical protein
MSAYRPCDLEFGDDDPKARVTRYTSTWPNGCGKTVKAHSQVLAVAGLRRDRLVPKPFWRQLSGYGSCHSMLTISCVPVSLSSSGESSGVRANQRPQ